MNPKILIAFAAGAIIASGIVYVAVNPEEVAKPAPVVVVRQKPPASVPVAQMDPAPVAVDPPAAPPEPVVMPAAPAPVREKPSPMRQAARRERPVVVARNEQPPQETAPSPMPSPINKERPYNDARPADPAPQPAPVADPQVVTPPPAPVVTAPPAPQEESPAPPRAQVPETRSPNTVTIQPGTILAVRIGETISSTRNVVGDDFLATLDRPLVIDGFVIAERGARVEGRVVEAQHPGRATGSSRLGVEIIEFSSSDGQRIRVRTATFKKDAGSFNGSDWAKVGAGAAIGAAIGGAAGGGKGAAIGAGVGGAAAGTADVLMTHGKPAEIPVETRMSFRIQEPITITERLQ